MGKIEFRGDLEDVVRAVLQVATNRAMAGKSFAPELAAKLLPDVRTQLRVNVTTMTKERALSTLALLGEDARDRIATHDERTVELHGEFSEEQLDAIVFLMHSARDGRPLWPRLW